MGSVIVADATVVIDFFNVRVEAGEFLEPLLQVGAVAIHPVAHMEVLHGAANVRELRLLIAACRRSGRSGSRVMIWSVASICSASITYRMA